MEACYYNDISRIIKLESQYLYGWEFYDYSHTSNRHLIDPGIIDIRLNGIGRYLLSVNISLRFNISRLYDKTMTTVLGRAMGRRAGITSYVRGSDYVDMNISYRRVRMITEGTLIMTFLMEIMDDANIRGFTNVNSICMSVVLL